MQILCSLHCVSCRSAGTIEVLSAYTKYVHVEDWYQHFYGMGGLTRSTRTSIFSNIQHYAVYVSTYWKLHALSPPSVARCALGTYVWLYILCMYIYIYVYIYICKGVCLGTVVYGDRHSFIWDPSRSAMVLTKYIRDMQAKELCCSTWSCFTLPYVCDTAKGILFFCLLQYTTQLMYAYVVLEACHLLWEQRCVLCTRLHVLY